MTIRAWITAAACATTLTTSLALPVHAAPIAPESGRNTPTSSPKAPVTAPKPATQISYTEALAALPEASRAVSGTQLRLVDATQKAADTREATQTALAALPPARDKLTQAQNLYTLALTEATETQNQIDATARQMYMGGAAPGLTEVILTSDTPEGFTRALDTSVYMSAASIEHVTQKDTADTNLNTVTAERDAAQANYDTVNAEAQTALAARTEAEQELTAAQTAYDEAQAHYDRLMQITEVNPEAEFYTPPAQCKNWLVKELANAGFRGENLREAWAIAMRESGGREDAVSSSGDYGVFQFNLASWGHMPWWDTKLMLTRDYNIARAAIISDYGRTWYPWGLDGHGRVNAGAYVNAGWSWDQIQSHIVEPYNRWYSAYPCVGTSDTDSTSLGS